MATFAILTAGGRLRPLLLVLPALAAALVPGISGVMVYDRAAILHGELWRLVTGHWVHFSAAHLVCDAAVLAGGAWFIERLGERRFPWICLAAALVIGLALLAGQPALLRYGGLSGLAMTSTVLAGLLALRDRPLRAFGMGLLLLAALRLLVDPGGGFALVDLAGQGIRLVPLSHGVGALCGVAAYLWAARGRADAAAAPPAGRPAAPQLHSGRRAGDRA